MSSRAEKYIRKIQALGVFLTNYSNLDRDPEKWKVLCYENKAKDKEKAAKDEAAGEHAAQEARKIGEGMREYKRLCGKEREVYAGDEDEEEAQEKEFEESAMDLNDEFLQLIGPVNDAFEKSVKNLQRSCMKAVQTCLVAKNSSTKSVRMENRPLNTHIQTHKHTNKHKH